MRGAGSGSYQHPHADQGQRGDAIGMGVGNPGRGVPEAPQDSNLATARRSKRRLGLLILG